MEYDIHLNERNPRYEYISQPFNPILPLRMLAGVYSKQVAFNIAPSGFATFIYDATSTPRPPGHIGFYGTTTGSFTQVDEVLNNCCVRFADTLLGKGINTTYNAKSTSFNLFKKENNLNISPNPNKGDLLKITYKFNNKGKVQLSIINALGQQVWQTVLNIPNSKSEITSVFNLSNLPLISGLYLIKLSNGIETQTAKLLISK